MNFVYPLLTWNASIVFISATSFTRTKPMKRVRSAAAAPRDAGGQRRWTVLARAASGPHVRAQRAQATEHGRVGRLMTDIRCAVAQEPEMPSRDSCTSAWSAGERLASSCPWLLSSTNSAGLVRSAERAARPTLPILTSPRRTTVPSVAINGHQRLGTRRSTTSTPTTEPFPNPCADLHSNLHGH